MIEDQIAPKRCGHTQGKAVVSFAEAVNRVRAAVDARDEGSDILVMARTDSNATDGLDDAIARCKAFRDVGADITFLEAPKEVSEMERYCNEVSGPKMANMVEDGATPVLTPAELQDLGYSIALYPVTTLRASIRAQQAALRQLIDGSLVSDEDLITFDELQDIVGFKQYFKDEDEVKRGAAKKKITKTHALLPHRDPKKVTN